MLAQTALEWTTSTIQEQYIRVPPEMLEIWNWIQENSWTAAGYLAAGTGISLGVWWLLRKGRKWWMSKDKRRNIVDAHVKDGVFYYLLEEKRKGKITPKEFMRYVRKFELLQFNNIAKTKAMIKYRLGQTHNGKGKIDYKPSPLPDRVERPEVRRNTYTTTERRRAFRKLEQVLAR